MSICHGNGHDNVDILEWIWIYLKSVAVIAADAVLLLLMPLYAAEKVWDLLLPIQTRQAVAVQYVTYMNNP